MTASYRIEELLAVEVARHLRDEEVVFIGIGTGGPAFAVAWLAVGAEPADVAVKGAVGDQLQRHAPAPAEGTRRAP